MRGFTQIAACVFLIVLLPCLGLAQPIRLRADLYPPYNDQPNSTSEGYMVDVARKIFEKAGHPVDYQVLPWGRSIRDAEVGAIEGIICAGKGDAPTFVFPEEPLGMLKYSFFVAKNSTWNFQGADSLTSIKLGVITDYSYGPTVDAYISKFAANPERIDAVAGEEALERNIQKLRTGRISALISADDVFRTTLRTLKIPADEFREAGAAPERDPVYIAFAPGKETSKQYAKLLSDGVRALRASGELEQILKRYAVKDWK